MSEGDMLVIRVPASSANLGPGFDSVGLALSRYLTLEAEKSERWEITAISEELKVFPKDESNYIVKVALRTAERYNRELAPCRISVSSDIPLARGLGSSAAAIIAGIELADSLCNLNLSKEEKFQLAAELEGHPDNVGASLYGGLIIGSQEGNSVDAISYNGLSFEVVAAIPRHELLTKDSRNVLPEEMPFGHAVRAGSVGNVLIAALLSGDYNLAGKMMKKDLYHQPYRRNLVPHLADLEEFATKNGAFGVALSGAGPTVICCCEKGVGEGLLEKLAVFNSEMDYYLLQIDQQGSQVEVKNRVK